MNKEEGMSPKLLKANDFPDFDSKEGNLNLWNKVKDLKKQIIKESTRYLVFKTLGKSKGWYIGYDKINEQVFYAVEYQKLDLKFLGPSVTQTLVWRQDGNSLSQGVTNYMIFTVLLPEFGILLSDDKQTPDGQRFWRNLIARAESFNQSFGLVNTSSQTIFKAEEGESSLKFWERVKDKAYGSRANFLNMRFFIEEKK